MTDYEKQQQFYQQFNTVKTNHAAWCQTPQGTLEIMKDPWKAQAPVVRLDCPFEENRARDILKMIRDRHNGVTP